MEPILEMAPGDDVVQDEATVPSGGDAPARKPLGEMLVDGGFLTQSQLQEALDEGQESGRRLGEVVVNHGWASEEDVAKLLAEQWGLSYVDRASIWFDAHALNRISREDAQRLEALPTRIEAGRIVVAVAEPSDQQIEELKQVIGEDPVVIVVPRSALEAGLHSDLLKGRGNGGGQDADAPRVEEVDEHAEVAEVEYHEPDGESPEATAPPVLSALPPPLPEEVRAVLAADRNSSDMEGLDSVAALAAQARGVADLIAAQAEAMRDQTSAHLDEYKQRIDRLEAELEAQRAELEAHRTTVREAKNHLEAVVHLLGDGS